MTSVTDVVVVGAGQSGLVAARTLQAHGISPVVLEAGPEPAGPWPRYYDSLLREATTHPPSAAPTRFRQRARPLDHVTAKRLIAGLFDEVVPAHIAVCFADLVSAFRAALPVERSGHAVDERGEHCCLLTDNSRIIPAAGHRQGQKTWSSALPPL